MKKLALIILAAASLLGTAGIASAQGYGGGIAATRTTAIGIANDTMMMTTDYYRRRHYSRPWNMDCYGRICPRGFTVQDCVCKPYRGY